MIRTRHFFTYSFLAAWSLMAGHVALADPLPKPTGPVVLQITGAISETNNGAWADFDLAMLHALQSTEFTTNTIWTDGLQRFAGVELGTILDRIGAEGSLITAKAINDYIIDIPIEDAEPGFALIAYQRNGAPMSVRDKGPLWVVYNYDQSPDFRSEVFFSRSVWQLDRLVIHR